MALVSFSQVFFVVLSWDGTENGFSLVPLAASVNTVENCFLVNIRVSAWALSKCWGLGPTCNKLFLFDHYLLDNSVCSALSAFILPFFCPLAVLCLLSKPFFLLNFFLNVVICVLVYVCIVQKMPHVTSRILVMVWKILDPFLSCLFSQPQQNGANVTFSF